MPPLAGDCIPSYDHAPIDNDAAADTCPENDAEHDICTKAGPVDRLGQREAVRVVRKPHGPPEGASQVVGQRVADEPRRVRVLDESGGRRHDPRHPDADGGG